MAGHSHWARIKHKKGVLDARRGRLWSKLARNVIVAARVGGGDPADNLALRYAIDKAKAANMPKDTIENAIKKGTGQIEGVVYEPVTYEGFGPGGVAILCECLTDNRNRTAPELKKLFERHGGNLGKTGSVSRIFVLTGVITVSAEKVSEDQIVAVALESGATDYQRAGDLWEITCEPSAFEPLRKALADAGIPVESAELSRVPTSTVTLDAETGKKVLALMESLEDHDDVQNAYANFELPEELMSGASQGNPS
ncbi:MAG TPA: YebC/PmpR family DNA-binding transcriptional regulator [Phycisphaerae bacterium]|nr:YebC/PmpR family DNA-binding transcriptional regulator [Phycisphaerae bacterium]